MKVKSESKVAQSCLTLRDPMDCCLPGSSAHGIFQARVLEWGAIALELEKKRKKTNSLLLKDFVCVQAFTFKRITARIIFDIEL